MKLKDLHTKAQIELSYEEAESLWLYLERKLIPNGAYAKLLAETNLTEIESAILEPLREKLDEYCNS